MVFMPTPSTTYQTLEEIASDVRTCTMCDLHTTRQKTVPGTGPQNAAIMFIGEAPGKQEDLQGLPFVGRSGTVLTELLQEVGLTRDEVFITSILKCRPPSNRNPRRQEINACEPYLQAQLRVIQPGIICTLGSPSTTTFLGKQPGGMTDIRGKWFRYQGMYLLPTFHPAYILRFPSKRKDALKDFQEIRRLYDSGSSHIGSSTFATFA